MKTFSWLAAVTFAAITATAAVAQQQSDDTSQPPKVTQPTRSQLKDKQVDVSLEARDIERILGKLKRVSDLAKSRIGDAAKSAEQVSTNLDKGDSPAARADAMMTAEMFAEIIKQLEVLLKEETPQQIAEAKKLAQRLARLEKEFAAKFPGALNPTSSGGKAKVDPKSTTVMANPNAKGQGSRVSTNANASAGSGGKQGKSKTGGNQPMPTDGMNGDDDKKPDETGQGVDPKAKPGTGKQAKNDGTNGGDEKNPDGNNGDGNEKKKPDGGGNGKDPQDKTGTGGDKDKTGDDPNKDDKPMPGGSGASKDRSKEDMPGDDQDGSGGDRPKDKSKNRKRSESGDADQTERQPFGGGGGSGKELTLEERRELVAQRAEQLANTGRTLQDVLNAIANSQQPADKDAAARIQSLLKELGLNKIVQEMGAIGNMIRAKADKDAQVSSLDIAERLEVMAQRLDSAYRVIVAPQAEELRKLEQMLADLREKLDKLETPAQVAAWHREARELLDRLDKMGVNLEARDLLEEAMQRAGFSVGTVAPRNLNWGVINGYYLPPDGYSPVLVRFHEELQDRIQSLVLGDLGSEADDVTPPKYQELVERYYQVLSGGGKSQTANPKAQEPRTKSPGIPKSEGSKKSK